MNYPTEWQGGIPGGFLKEETLFYRVSMCPLGMKKYFKIFYFDKPARRGKDITDDQIFDNKNDALNASNNYMMQESDKINQTQNKWRYIDANSIEVKLGDEHTFITDYKHLDKVIKYPMCAKKRGNDNRYYVMSYDKTKKHFPFYTLIKPDIKIVNYIDGNSLNVRESNLQEFGAVKIAPKVAELIEKSNDIKLEIDQYENFNNIEIPWILPKNVWILGKPSGTVFERNNIYYARITNGETYASKTFQINNNKESKFIEAKKWQYNTSYKLGLTKNLIKILDDKYIEVQLSKDQIMKTNIELIDLIQKNDIHVTKSRDSINYYAGVSITNDNIKKEYKFHNIILRSTMTDHVNGDTLDNRIENLRECDHYINNANRHLPKDQQYLGEVVKTNTSAYINLTIKINNTPHLKRLYFDDPNDAEDEDEVKKLKHTAYEFREWIINGTWSKSIKDHISQRDLDIIYDHSTCLSKHMKNIIKDVTKEKYFSGPLSNLNISSISKTIIYSKYKQTRIDMYQNDFNTLLTQEKKIIPKKPISLSTNKSI